MYRLVCLYTLLTAALATAAPGIASQWFTVEWNGVEFSDMSGTFTIPNLPQQSNAVFLWPGLQGSDGALQAQLTNVSGKLGLRNIFYGGFVISPEQPFTVTPGDTVQFSFTRAATGIWLATFSGKDEMQTIFDIPGSVMNRAIFAIQLNDNVLHDFDVQYKDIVITAVSSPAADWCSKTAFNGFQGYTIQGAVAIGTSCHINQLNLPATA